ncbi:MAG: SpoIIE family protein phosphatase [Gammaproteobacteria bacterium]|nr:SpoIIE family protein phosphatase [Gammaproteobacteria bacterium]
MPISACNVDDEPAVLTRRFNALHALVIEDNEVDRYLVQRMLMDLGFTVEVTSTVADALALMLEQRPDVVCCDIGLPGVDGYVLARAVRERFPDAHIPVIFITGLSDEDALLRCFAAGGDDVMVKPLNPARLKAKLVAALRTRELNDTLLAQRDQLARYQADTQRDMAIAKTIIDNLGCERTLDLPNVSYHLAPMDTLNGDIIIGGRSPRGAQYFLFGDFTGHGLPAAIGVQVVYGVFRAMVARGHALEQMAQELNRKVRETLPRDRFLSAALIEIYPDSGTVSVWNGGMPEILLRNAAGSLRKGFRSTYLPLGVLPPEEFDARPVRRQLRENDTLFCYSDGVIEALDAGGTMFGQARVKLCVTGGTHDSVAAVRTALETHVGNVPQQDDISMLEVRFRHDALYALPGAGAALMPARPATHWRVALDFAADALRNADPLPALGAVLDAVQGFGPGSTEIYMVTSTLFGHVLEQGLLQLESGLKSDSHDYAFYYLERERRLAELVDAQVHLELAHRPDDEGGELEICVSGQSAHCRTQQPQALAATDLALLAKLCASYEVSETCCRASARYRWRRGEPAVRPPG